MEEPRGPLWTGEVSTSIPVNRVLTDSGMELVFPFRCKAGEGGNFESVLEKSKREQIKKKRCHESLDHHLDILLACCYATKRRSHITMSQQHWS